MPESHPSPSQIKPGDIVCYGRERSGQRYFVDYILGKLAMLTLIHGTTGAPTSSISLKNLRALRLVIVGSAEAGRDGVLRAARTGGIMGAPARKEALAKGWRQLDRSDVTEQIKLIDVLIGGVAIGCVERSHPKRWTWTHWSPDFDVIGRGHGESKEEAEDQLVAAENTRRAAQQKGQEP